MIDSVVEVPVASVPVAKSSMPRQLLPGRRIPRPPDAPPPPERLASSSAGPYDEHAPPTPWRCNARSRSRSPLVSLPDTDRRHKATERAEDVFQVYLTNQIIDERLPCARLAESSVLFCSLGWLIRTYRAMRSVLEHATHRHARNCACSTASATRVG
jgi:hypothetical protein